MINHLISNEKQLVSFSRDILNTMYRDISEILFLKNDMSILHDTYKCINNIAHYLDKVLFPSFNSISWSDDNFKDIEIRLLRRLAELTWSLVNTRSEISGDSDYVERIEKRIKNIYEKTETFKDFVLFRDGTIIECDDRSHDMTIAQYLLEKDVYYKSEILPDDYVIGSPIVLSRSATDKWGILRFHVAPIGKEYICANKDTVNLKDCYLEKEIIRKNYLYRKAVGEIE